MNAESLRRPGRPSLSNAQLLDHALDLFLELGFERTSIEAICAKAGMAKRTVYARYGDKQSLFKAALTRAIADWIVPIDTLRAAETDDLEESLLAIGQLLVENLISPAGLRLLRLTNAESGRMPEIGAFNVEQGTRPTIEYLADLFHRRVSGEIEAEFAGEAFLNLINGPSVSAAWGVKVDPEVVANHTSLSVKLFLHGILDSGQGKSDDTIEATGRFLDDSLTALDQARENIIMAKAAGRS